MIWQAIAFAQAAVEKAKLPITPPQPSPDTAPYFIIALLLGALVGAAELVSRYRSAPLRAVQAGYFYVLVNAAASMGALYLVLEMNWIAADQTDPNQRLILQTLVASFGAMAFFRSSLFTLRVGDTDVAVGPMSVLQALLNAADRSTDRVCATPRADAVTRIMSGISFERAKEALPALCFSLMQNINLEERAEIRAAVDSLTAANMQDTDKASNLGLTLMNLVGETVLQRAVDILRRSIRLAPRELSLRLIPLISNVDFQRDALVLLNYLMLLTGFGAEKELRTTLEKQISDIDVLQVQPGSKVFALVSILITEFGEESVERALRALPSNASAQPPAPPPQPPATPVTPPPTRP